MGFFSSIGSVLGGGLGFLVGGPAGAVVGGGLGGGIGSGIESNQANKTAQGYYNSQMAFAQQQAQFNQDYVKNAIQWRVEDAKKAGLHPMAALGFSSPSYSAVSAPSAPSYVSGNSIDPMEFGQSLNYAATKGKDKQQQADMLNLQVEGLMLDNEYKRAQIDQLKVDTLAASIASDQALFGPGAPQVNSQSPVNGLNEPSGSDAFSVRHIRDNDYDINFNQEYQQELGDEAGQFYNMLRKATRENGTVWTDPKDGVAYVFDRYSGYWHRLANLEPEEAARLLGGSSNSYSGNMPLSSSHRVRNSYRYR